MHTSSKLCTPFLAATMLFGAACRDDKPPEKTEPADVRPASDYPKPERRDREEPVTQRDYQPGQTEPSATRPAVDNTRMNERDRDDTVTPMDQSNDPVDLDTTKKIRDAIMDDDSLSFNAKNVKIITAKGVITLRGPVKNEAERKAVEAKAAEFAGANRVDNQLEVEAVK